VDEGFGCANPFDLGVLSGTEIRDYEANPAGQPNLLNTTCSEDDHSAQAVYKFQVEEPIRMSSRIVGSSQILVQELRVGSCTTATEEVVQFCSINRQEWTAMPGQDYFIIIEARVGDPEGDEAVGESGLISNFDFELTTEEFVCFPAGEKTCVGDDIEFCAGGDEIRTTPCGTGCQNGECLGDSCANPLEVNGSVSVDVELSSYSNTNNFQESPSGTSSGATGSGTNTTGQDLVFFLPGLSGGQTVEVVADSTFVIGVMESCGAATPSCVAGNDLDGELSWEVEEAGDYYVVVDRFLPSSVGASITIDIID
jgi:hypothetical protein